MDLVCVCFLCRVLLFIGYIYIYIRCQNVEGHTHGVDPLSYFSFQPVLHDWCNKGRGMCNPVCGMVYIKEPLLLIFHCRYQIIKMC